VVKFLTHGGLLFLLCHALAFSQSAERLSLTDAITIALQQNPEIQGARSSVDAAQARFWRGISPPPATLSVTHEYIPAGSGINNYGERSIGVSQSFDFPTTIALRGSSLSSETDAAGADFHSMSLSVTMRVKSAYFGVLARQQKLSLAEDNLGIANDFAQKAGVRFGVGEGTTLEHLTAKAQRTQAHIAVDAASNELKLAMGELDLVLGRGQEMSGRQYVLTDSLAYRPHTLLLESLIEQARHSNPHLQSATFRRNAASVNRTIAWSSILPSFTVSYYSQVQGVNPNLYGVSLGIALPIWFLLDQRGQIQEASATYAKAESDVLSIGNLVSYEVKNAYLELMNDERQVQLYNTDLLPQAQEVYRAAATSYEAGEISYMEFLQARQTLISARGAYIDALYHYNTAIARLEHAVGREASE
jgi:outer membrane protein TolC